MDMNRSQWIRFVTIAVLVALPLALVACGGGGEEAAAPAGGEEAAPAETAAPAGAQEAAEVGAGYDEIKAMQEGDATISGTVHYVGQVPNLPPIAMDADPTCAEKHDGPVPNEALVLGEGNTMANVFVQVKDSFAQGDYQAPSTPAVIDQRGCLYHPHVLGMMAGQQLQFLNSDGILHNVHGTPSDNREFNLGMPGSLHEKAVTLNQPELYVPVKCDVHPWMSAYVGVMTHPYFQVTEKDGAFEIKVPAGTYTLEAWQEKLGTRTQEVTVAAGETATVDFQFDVPNQ